MDKTLLKQAKNYLDQDEDVVLVAVESASGSTPGRRGDMMLVSSGGIQAGTVGGGAVEYRSGLQAVKDLKDPAFHFAVRGYNLGLEGAASLGMACGGRTDLCFFKIRPTAENKALFARAERLFREQISFGLSFSYGENRFEIELISKTAYRSAVSLSKEGDRTVLYIPVTGDRRVIICGGGHIAQSLAPLLGPIDFPCVVIDDSDAFANRENFKSAQEIIVAPFEEGLERAQVRKEDFIVILTRGHSFDYICEKWALEHQPAPDYIGCIGSKKKTEMVRGKLKAAGIDQARIDSVHAPIGLKIGAMNPQEIAISIAAQLIETRHKLTVAS